MMTLRKLWLPLWSNIPSFEIERSFGQIIILYKYINNTIFTKIYKEGYALIIYLLEFKP